MHASLDHYWQTILRPLFEAAGVRSILEIGSGFGRNTKNLIAYAREKSGMVFGVDPAPQFDVFEWRMEYADCLRFYEETSLHALARLEDRFDAVLIDGDHNWYTVFHELQLLDRRTPVSSSFPVTVLHDVGWPYARRDQYCDPERIPSAFRHSCEKKGITKGTAELMSGRGMNPTHWNACAEYSPRNGVLTAVEDFMLQSNRSFTWVDIPGFFGLGILVEKSLLEATPDLRSFLAELSPSSILRQHLESLEDDRIRLGIEATEARREADRVYRTSVEEQRSLESALSRGREEARLKNRQIDRLTDEKTQLALRLADREHECGMLAFVRDSLQREMAVLEAGIDRMQRSRSWRITRFLRVLEPKIRSLLGMRSSARVEHLQVAPLPPSSPRAQPLVFCTIVSRNFLAYALALASSIRSAHPDVEIIVLLVDAFGDGFSGLDEPFTVLPLEDLPLPDRDSLCFRYGIRELHTAVKPFFLQWIFDHRPSDHVVYLDPDIAVHNPLDSVRQALKKHSIVLTPHVLAPIQDGLRPSEHDVLRVGVFNLGFIGLARESRTFDFLRWWQRKVTDECTEEPNRNVFFDQRWMDLVPALFQDVGILRDPSCNVAYWNLHERTVSHQQGRWMVNGVPLTFFHFSGFRPDRPDRICKYDHSDRSLQRYPALEPLLREYAGALLQCGWRETRHMPYVFATFHNGVRIPMFARRHFQRLASYQRARFQNPFGTGSGSYWDWLFSERARTNSGISLSNAHFLLWQSAPELQRQFPRIGDQFAEWLFSPASRTVFPDVPEEFFSLPKPMPETEQRSYFSRLFSRRNSFGFYRLCTECARRLLPRSAFAFIRDHFSSRDLIPCDRARKVRVPRPFGLNLVGAFTSGTGVGQAARLHLLAAESVGIPVTIHNLQSPFQEREHTPLQSRFSQDYSYETTLFHLNADRLPSFLSAEDPAALSHYRSIAYWVWELSRFPKEHRAAAKWFDEIWTPSRFSADAIAACVDCPVHVIPHPVHVPGGMQFGRPYFGIKKDACVFLFVFNCQSVAERKNPAAVIDAFKKAFSPDENVQLVLKYSNAKDDPSLHRRLVEAARGHNILLLDSFFTNRQTHDLIRCCDVYVSLHRSEGFGLTVAEAMFLGKPVIATNYSGNAEYMTKENSMPIGYTLIPLDRHHPPYRKGNVWADPDVSEASMAMRRLFEDRAFARALGTRAALDIRRTHAPEVIGKLMRDRLASE